MFWITVLISVCSSTTVMPKTDTFVKHFENC